MLSHRAANKEKAEAGQAWRVQIPRVGLYRRTPEAVADCPPAVPINLWSFDQSAESGPKPPDIEPDSVST